MPLIPPLEYHLYGNDSLWKTIRQLSSTSLNATQCLSSPYNLAVPVDASQPSASQSGFQPSSGILGSTLPPTAYSHRFPCLNPQQKYHRFWFELHEYAKLSSGTLSSVMSPMHPTVSISPSAVTLVASPPASSAVPSAADWYSHPFRIVLCLDTTMLLIASAPSREIIMSDWESLVVKTGYQSIVDAALAQEHLSPPKRAFSPLEQATRIHAFLLEIFGLLSPLPLPHPSSPPSPGLPPSPSNPLPHEAFLHAFTSGSFVQSPDSPCAALPLIPVLPTAKRKLLDVLSIKQVTLDVISFPHVPTLLHEFLATAHGGPVEIGAFLVRYGYLPQDLLFSKSLDLAGQKFLHLAAFKGLDAVVKFLLSTFHPHSLSLHVRDSNAWTPLLSACSSNHWGIAKQLLDAGSPVLSIASSGSTALHYIARHAQPNLRTSGNASSGLYLALLKQMVDCGGSALLNIQDSGGETALHQSCSRGLTEMAQYLLGAGASINLVTKWGDTPLHSAIRAQSQSTVELLMHHPVKLYKRSQDGTPLDIAKNLASLSPVTPGTPSEQVQILKLLLKPFPNSPCRWNAAVDKPSKAILPPSIPTAPFRRLVPFPPLPTPPPTTSTPPALSPSSPPSPPLASELGDSSSPFLDHCKMEPILGLFFGRIWSPSLRTLNPLVRKIKSALLAKKHDKQIMRIFGTSDAKLLRFFECHLSAGSPSLCCFAQGILVIASTGLFFVGSENISTRLLTHPTRLTPSTDSLDFDDEITPLDWEDSFLFVNPATAEEGLESNKPMARSNSSSVFENPQEAIPLRSKSFHNLFDLDPLPKSESFGFEAEALHEIFSPAHTNTPPILNASGSLRSSLSSSLIYGDRSLDLTGLEAELHRMDSILSHYHRLSGFSFPSTRFLSLKFEDIRDFDFPDSRSLSLKIGDGTFSFSQFDSSNIRDECFYLIQYLQRDHLNHAGSPKPADHLTADEIFAISNPRESLSFHRDIAQYVENSSQEIFIELHFCAQCTLMVSSNYLFLTKPIFPFPKLCIPLTQITGILPFNSYGILQDSIRLLLNPTPQTALILTTPTILSSPSLISSSSSPSSSTTSNSSMNTTTSSNNNISTSSTSSGNSTSSISKRLSLNPTHSSSVLLKDSTSNRHLQSAPHPTPLNLTLSGLHDRPHLVSRLFALTQKSLDRKSPIRIVVFGADTLLGLDVCRYLHNYPGIQLVAACCPDSDDAVIAALQAELGTDTVVKVRESLPQASPDDRRSHDTSPLQQVLKNVNRILLLDDMPNSIVAQTIEILTWLQVVQAPIDLIVRYSWLPPFTSSLSISTEIHKLLVRAESLVIESPFHWTLVRGALPMQLFGSTLNVQGGTLHLPLSNAFPWVDLVDISSFLAQVIAEGPHVHGTQSYFVGGPELLTPGQLCAIISKAIYTPLSFRLISGEQAVRAIRATISSMFRSGKRRHTSSDAQELLAQAIGDLFDIFSQVDFRDYPLRQPEITRRHRFQSWAHSNLIPLLPLAQCVDLSPKEVLVIHQWYESLQVPSLNLGEGLPATPGQPDLFASLSSFLLGCGTLLVRSQFASVLYLAIVRGTSATSLGVTADSFFWHFTALLNGTVAQKALIMTNLYDPMHTGWIHMKTIHRHAGILAKLTGSVLLLPLIEALISEIDPLRQGILSREVFIRKLFKSSEHPFIRHIFHTTFATASGNSYLPPVRNIRQAISFWHPSWHQVQSIALLFSRSFSTICASPNGYLPDSFSRESDHTLTLDLPCCSDKCVGRAYAPFLFRIIRSLFGVTEVDFLVSMGIERIIGGLLFADFAPLVQLSSSGRSGSFFFTSYDSLYLIKTLPTEEEQLLRRILPSYYRYMFDNPNSLIQRFYGLHHLKPRLGKELDFVVLENVFKTSLVLHEQYDLKGSTVNRSVGSTDANVARKDLDFHHKIRIGTLLRGKVIEQIERDTAWLASYNLCDYSLLVGFHWISEEERSQHFTLCEDANQVPKNPDRSLFKAHDGGILSEDGQVIYFIGIIDSLTTYDLKKKTEHHFKSLFHDPTQISAIPPEPYRERFLKYVASILK